MMLNPNTLQTPKSGRSRFSKALPALPTSLDSSSPLGPPPKDLPELPIPASAPPHAHAHPPRSDSITKPAASLRPRLPPLQTSAVPRSGPTPMSIPRRPVGKPASQPLPQAEGQSPAPAPPQAKELAFPPPPEPASPAYSLSSLLSAYSRSSDESVQRSDGFGSSGRESDAHVSPNQDEAVTVAVTSDDNRAASVARKPVGDGSKRPPSPPSQDDKHGLAGLAGLAVLAASPAPTPKAIGSPASPQSQSQSQIWRRRSPNFNLKGERSLELPDLELLSSHGSTASSQPPPGPPEPPKAAPLPPALHPPRAPAGGLPGRNIRPAASREPEPAPDSQAMGNDTSKLRSLKDNLHFPHRKNDGSSSTRSDTMTRPGAHRPPTPEYQKEDVRTPIVDTFVSPVSPASSPEPPARAVSPDFPKELPPTAAPSVRSKSITRNAAPAPGPPAGPATHRDVTPHEVPGLKVTPQTPIATPEPSTRDPSVNRDSAASDTASSRTHHSVDSTRFTPRTSSSGPDRPRIAERPRQPTAELDPRLVSSDSQGPLYRGRDGTLYPEMKVRHEAESPAVYFPSQWNAPMPEGAIIGAAPLKNSHFGCYQHHRTMNRRVNKTYPLTCQACHRPDTEDRWTCIFCHLRLCESCFGAFNGNQRDLQRLMENLGARALIKG